MRKMFIVLAVLSLFAVPAYAGGEWDVDGSANAIFDADSTKGAGDLVFSLGYKGIMDGQLALGVTATGTSGLTSEDAFPQQRVSIFGRFYLGTETSGLWQNLYAQMNLGDLYLDFSGDGTSGEIWRTNLRMVVGYEAKISETFGFFGTVTNLSDLESGTFSIENTAGLGVRFFINQPGMQQDLPTTEVWLGTMPVIIRHGPSVYSLDKPAPFPLGVTP